ncbi:hypothetical protein M422DRAFT_247461 [Sphaerobolus stellatus SS14]|nr:hypothetical protein M422DRAFT_247461 [Sphaerobolus stellatus SS14]
MSATRENATPTTTNNPPPQPKKRGRPKKQQTVALPVTESADTALDSLPALNNAFRPPPGIAGTSFTPEVQDPLLEENDPYFRNIHQVNRCGNSPVDETNEGSSISIEKSSHVQDVIPVSVQFPKELNQLEAQQGIKATKVTRVAGYRIQHCQEIKEFVEQAINTPIQSAVMAPRTVSKTVANPPSLTPTEVPQAPVEGDSNLEVPEQVDDSVIDPVLKASSTAVTPNPAPSTTNLTPASTTSFPATPQVVSGKVSSKERNPTFRDGKILLSTASPKSKPVISEASLGYKLRIITQHPFPETANLKGSFLQEAWNDAHKSKPPTDGFTLKLNEAVAGLVHSMGTSFRGGAGSKLTNAAPGAYNIPMPLTPVGQNMIKELLKDGNLTWKAVIFDDQGFIQYTATEPKLPLCMKPMFGHPFLQTVLDIVLFNPENRPALAARFKEAFDPIPLETVAYACTMAHFTLSCVLKSALRQKKDSFNGDTYAPIFAVYLEMLQEFMDDEPEECEQVLAGMLAAGRKTLGECEEAALVKKKKNRAAGFSGLSEDAFNKEVSMMHGRSTPLVAGVAIATAVGNNTSASVSNTNIIPMQMPHYGAPYGMPYGYPQPSTMNSALQYTVPQPPTATMPRNLPQDQTH